jgi:phosphoribosylaminoimidazole carboxylase (NCAIR synthetase)
MPDDWSVFEVANAVIHDYSKKARPDRKLGHATIVGVSIEDRDQRLLALRDALSD